MEQREPIISEAFSERLRRANMDCSIEGLSPAERARRESGASAITSLMIEMEIRA